MILKRAKKDHLITFCNRKVIAIFDDRMVIAIAIFLTIAIINTVQDREKFESII